MEISHWHCKSFIKIQLKSHTTSHLDSVILNLFFLLLQVNVWVKQSFIFCGFVTDILKLSVSNLFFQDIFMVLFLTNYRCLHNVNTRSLPIFVAVVAWSWCWRAAVQCRNEIVPTGHSAAFSCISKQHSPWEVSRWTSGEGIWSRHLAGGKRVLNVLTSSQLTANSILSSASHLIFWNLNSLIKSKHENWNECWKQLYNKTTMKHYTDFRRPDFQQWLG